MGSLRLKFLGTRGLVPSPRKETAIYGGNTTCIQILHEDHLVIVDTSFGVALLGEDLLTKILQEKKRLTIHIFFTHFHWDHIQGLPFFHPIYFPSTHLHLYAPMPYQYIWESLDILFDGSYSPFAGIKSMPSKIDIHELQAPMTIGDMKISYAPVDHSVFSHGDGERLSSTFAYRFEVKDHSIVIACDHEARQGFLNQNFVEFAQKASILVHDAQWLQEEAPSQGWGHSTVTQALENAKVITPKLTLLTHHDPAANDSDIAEVFKKMKSNEDYKDLNFDFAREGIIYDPDSL